MLPALVVFCIVIPLVALAAPVSDDAQAKINSYENKNDGSGNYEFSFETSNGLFRSETGELVNAGKPDAHIVVQGSYSYIDPEGKEQLVQYVADENGFRIIEQPELVAQALPAAAIATLLG